MKGRTGEPVKLGFSARHAGISVWVLSQQLSSITKPFSENVSAIVLFYAPSTKTTKAIFEEYAGELSHDELKQMIARLKKEHFGRIIFSLRKPYSIEQNSIEQNSIEQNSIEQNSIEQNSIEQI